MRKTVRSHECPGDRALQDFFQGTTTPEILETVAAHVESCTECVDKLRLLEDGNSERIQRVGSCSEASSIITEDLKRKLIGLAGSSPHLALETLHPQGDTQQQTIQQSDLDLSFLGAPTDESFLGVLGKYQVQKVLGAGGMGIVLQAVDPELRRDVAIKVMRPEYARNQEAIHRFARESRALAGIDNQHVVPVYEVYSDASPPYFVMPLLRGKTLNELITQSNPLSTEQILEIAQQATQGLIVAHDNGLIHRDIKPSNLFQDSTTQRIVLIDFGLVRSLDGDTMVTHFNRMAGTPACMAPEQASKAGGDERSDLFSLGCVLYELSTGVLPFQREDVMSTLMAVVQHDPEPPHLLNAEIPLSLSMLVMQLLEKNPVDRPASARELLRELHRLPVDGCNEAAESEASRLGEQGRSYQVPQAVAEPVIVAGEEVSRRHPQRQQLHWWGLFGLLLVLSIWLIIKDKDGNEKQRVKLSPGDRLEIVDRERPQAAAPNFPSATQTEDFDVDRQSAEWIIDAGGSVRILTIDGKLSDHISVAESLPKTRFTIFDFDLRGVRNVTTEDISFVSELRRLGGLYVGQSMVDSGLFDLLERHPLLNHINMNNTPIRLSELSDSRISKQLSSLVLSLKQVDEWNCFEELPLLRSLSLNCVGGTITDSILVLGTLPHLHEIYLNGAEHVPEDIILQLQEKNPRLRIMDRWTPNYFGRDPLREPITDLMNRGYHFRGVYFPENELWDSRKSFDPARCFSLQSMDLPEGHQFSNQTAEFLKQIPQLRGGLGALGLKNSGEFVEYLIDSARDTVVVLERSDITDEHLFKLKDSRIRELFLGGTSVSRSAIETLKTARPELWIHSDYGDFLPEPIETQVGQ